jgi:hypothetical protein
MSMEIGFSLRQSVRVETRISVTQRIAIKTELLQLRLEVVEAIHGETYNPKGDCPNCGRVLTGLEILAGFNTNPADVNTTCPKCKTRFPPILHRKNLAGSIEFPFYCAVQTLDRLPPLRDLPLEEFRLKQAPVYHSALVHFGGLKQAFRRIGLVYAFEAETEWRTRIIPFLGRLPDAMLARIVGGSTRQIRKMRRARDIPTFSRRKRAEELDADN